MKVFVTGATGYVGSALIHELIGAGHQVLGLARSEETAQKLTAIGVEVHRGSLTDLDSLRRGAAASDGVIHTAYNHDFSAYATAGETDRQAVEALGRALIGSNRPFVITSGVTVLTPGRIATETDPLDPNTASAPRIPSEEVMEVLATQGVRTSVVRLAPSVHGEGDYGFVPTLINIARDKGVSAYISDGTNRWPAVHRLDAVRLFRLALEKGTPGAKYHGVADEGIAVRDIATIIGQHLHLPIVSKAADEAADHFGWIGAFLSVDCPASSARTQQQLGWHPSQPSLIADLDLGHYFEEKEHGQLRG